MCKGFDVFASPEKLQEIAEGKAQEESTFVGLFRERPEPQWRDVRGTVSFDPVPPLVFLAPGESQ